MTNGRFHALASDPGGMFPKVFLFLLKKTEFQSNNGQYGGIPCLTIDSVVIGQVHGSVIAEITGT